jgi:hypothetical protein
MCSRKKFSPPPNKIKLPLNALHLCHMHGGGHTPVPGCSGSPFWWCCSPGARQVPGARCLPVPPWKRCVCSVSEPQPWDRPRRSGCGGVPGQVPARALSADLLRRLQAAVLWLSAALPAAGGRATAGGWLVHKLAEPAGMPAPGVQRPRGRPVGGSPCQQRPLLFRSGLAVCSTSPHCRAWLCLQRQRQRRLHSLAQRRAAGDAGHSSRRRQRAVAQAAVALPKPLRLLQSVPRSERQCCECRCLLLPAPLPAAIPHLRAALRDQHSAENPCVLPASLPTCLPATQPNPAHLATAPPTHSAVRRRVQLSKVHRVEFQACGRRLPPLPHTGERVGWAGGWSSAAVAANRRLDLWAM